MTRFALRALAGRKLRATLTAIAIVLGVAMVSGTYVLTDTINKAFDQVFTESYKGTSAVVTGKDVGISAQGNSAEPPPVSASLLDRVEKVDGVAAATGTVAVFDAKLVGKNGKVIDAHGAPSFGFGVDVRETRFNPLRIVAGHWMSGADEAVIDEGTADSEGYKIGDSIGVAEVGPVRRFRISGIARYGSVKSLGSATFVVVDVPTGQKLFNREGKFDSISIAADPGVTPQQIVHRVAAILPPGTQARTAEQQASKDKKDISDFTKIIRYFLLAFAGIALFVGAFVIFNTLSITVAQRTREFATLRTIGASRRQVLGSVLTEAFVIGSLASLVGLGFGYVLARLLNALFVSLGIDLPQTGTVFAARTVVISLLVGIVVTVVAGLAPALRATRVPPIAAVREGATLPRGALAPYTPFIAVVTIVGAVALLVWSMFAADLGVLKRLLAIGGGTLLLFTGVALVSGRFVPRLARVSGPIAKWVVPGLYLLSTVYFGLLGFWFWTRVFSRGSGRFVALPWAILLTVVSPVFVLGCALVWLARWGVASLRRRPVDWPPDRPRLRPDPTASRIGLENARRNPGRTAATAAALMIGLALVTFVAVLGQGLRVSNRDAIEAQVRAEYVVTSQSGFEPFTAGAGKVLERSSRVEFATGVRSDLAKVAGKSGYVTGIDPDAITRAYTFDWKTGSDAVLRQLGTNGAIVDKSLADDKHLHVGDTVTMLTPSGKKVPLVVKAIYRPPPFYPLLGSVSIPRATFDRLYDIPRDQFVFVDVPGEPTTAALHQLERIVREYPDAKVRTREGWIKQQDADATQFLNLLYILLALSVIVSLFGIVNTLVLSVFERTRELGMLRAVGMTRRQVRRMIRHESVITALIGAALGMPLGIALALLVNRALQQYDIAFAIPVVQLIVFAFVAIVAGLLAAIAPARRASRLRILEALQYE